MTSQVKLAELRDTLREILERYRVENIEETIFAIVSAANLAFSSEDNVYKRRGTTLALLEGLTRTQAIKTKCYERFHLNYSWNTKNGQDLLEFLASVPEEQTIDKFADWWRVSDWRGKAHQPPTIQQIYENWPLAFVEPEQNKPNIYRAEEDNE